MPIDDLTALGQKMREARKNKELTQQELSDLSHVSVKQIANIEKGKMNPSYLILRALAKVLHISLDTLINPDIHNVRVRSIRPCSFPLKWRYGLTKFPIGTSRPQTNVSASLHCFVLDSASWDIAPVSRLNMCVLWKSWIAINRNERRNVNARSRNRYFQVKKCSSHLKPRRINAHKSF